MERAANKPWKEQASGLVSPVSPGGPDQSFACIVANTTQLGGAGVESAPNALPDTGRLALGSRKFRNFMRLRYSGVRYSAAASFQEFLTRPSGLDLKASAFCFPRYAQTHIAYKRWRASNKSNFCTPFTWRNEKHIRTKQLSGPG